MLFLLDWMNNIVLKFMTNKKSLLIKIQSIPQFAIFSTYPQFWYSCWHPVKGFQPEKANDRWKSIFHFYSESRIHSCQLYEIIAISTDSSRLVIIQNKLRLHIISGRYRVWTKPHTRCWITAKSKIAQGNIYFVMWTGMSRWLGLSN